MNGLAARLRGTARSPFLRAVAMLSGGQSVAMLIPILAAPILGRLYAPADYGALAQYMAPAAVLGVVATLQFQHAIITERTDRTAAAVGWLCILTSVAMAGLVALGVAAAWSPWLSGTGAGLWFAALPLTVAGAGVIAAGGVLANRHRRYRWLALMQVVHVVATVALSIGLGWLAWGADGLLTAYLAGQALQLGTHAWLLAGVPGIRGSARPAQLRVLARRHWRFPAFTMPGEFLGQINMQAPVFALTALGADATLGAFSRARSLVSMPIGALGGAVAQVFRREAAAQYHATGSCRRLMLRTAGGLFVAGIGPCLLFIAFAPWLFTLYLGPAWREAGEIARILAPMLLLRLVMVPISTVFLFTNNQRLDFFLMLAATLIVIGGIAASIAGSLGSEEVIILYSASYSAVYLIYIVLSFKLSTR